MEEIIRLEARLGAIEFAICELAAMSYQIGGWTDAQVKERHDHWKNLASSTPIDGLDAAEAAYISGEIEDALSALSALIRTHMATLLQKKAEYIDFAGSCIAAQSEPTAELATHRRLPLPIASEVHRLAALHQGGADC